MNSLSAVAAMAVKDFRTAVSYKLGFVTGMFGAFWGLVGLRLLSKLVTGGAFAGGQTNYFKFVVIGVVLIFVLEPSVTAGANSVRQDQVQGTLEYLATLPIPRFLLGVCWSAYALVQSLVLGALLVVVVIPLGFSVSHVDVPVIVATVVLTVVVFLAVGNLGAALVLAFQQGTAVVAAVVAFATLLSGTFVPISELPRWLQHLAWLSPLTYSLAALRTSLLANQPPTSLARDLLVLLGFAVVLVPLSGKVLDVAFRFAQRRGTLSTF